MEKQRLKQCCRFSVFVLLAVFVFMSKQSFGEFKHPGIVSIHSLAAFMGNAFPTNPMLEDMTELKIAPGIFSFSKNARISNTCSNTSCDRLIQSEDGNGISFSLVHAFTPNIGMGISGAYVKSDGSVSATGHSTIGFTDSRKYSGPVKETGSLAAAAVILDPFSDPDGFRMPFALGFSYQDISVDWDVPFNYTSGFGATQVGDRGQDTGRFRLSSLGWYAGFSLQFNTWLFRWSPFAVAADAFTRPEYTWTVKNLTRGNSVEQHQTSSQTGSSSFGMPVTFRPLGLTFSYVYNWVDDPQRPKFNTYILSWSKKW